MFRLALTYRLSSWPRMSKTSRRKLRNRNWPDRLSGWTLSLPSARAVGEVELVRVFESAEGAATAFWRGRVSAAKVPKPYRHAATGTRLRS